MRTTMDFESYAVMDGIPFATGEGTVTIESDPSEGWYFCGPVTFKILNANDEVLEVEADARTTDLITDRLFADWFWREHAEYTIASDRTIAREAAADFRREGWV